MKILSGLRTIRSFPGRKVIASVAGVGMMSFGFASCATTPATTAFWCRNFHYCPTTTTTTPPTTTTTRPTNTTTSSAPTTTSPPTTTTVKSTTTTTKPTTTTTHPTTTTTHPTTTTTAPTTTTTLSTTTTTSGSTTDPSGQAAPVGNITGWNQVCVDDFTVPAATGSWGTSDASKVVYTGDHGCKWTEYPDGWSSTNTGGSPGYSPSTVLSVHDSVLDFNLKPINGHAEGANPSPELPSSSYTTYGMFTFRMKTDQVSGYHSAVLLWPNNDNDWQCAESDFPEFDLTSSSVSAYAHDCGGSQDAFEGNKIDVTQWHTYTQTWAPGQRQYFIDGKLIGTNTKNVYSGPERWQFQIEPSGTAAGGTGHLEIDWAAAYTRA